MPFLRQQSAVSCHINVIELEVGGKVSLEVLPELAQLEHLIAHAPAALKVEVLAQVPHMTQQLPLYALTLGNTAATKPAVVLVGGVHGLERIGPQVVLAYLQTLLLRLDWDRCL